MANQQATDWSPAYRVAFRFFFLYLILYILPQPGATSLIDLWPGDTTRVDEVLAWPLKHLAVGVGVHLFHLQGTAATFHPTGSGDTALNYVWVFLILTLALLGTILWSLLDRRRTQYRVLDAWLRLLVSLTLGTTLFGYGFAKVWPGQFGPPVLSRLSETYGQSSPMGLLWTFMSSSRWYTMFGGFAEVIPGLLLFFRRTRTLGALLAAAVLVNIVVLNFCYDVPVKLYSTHLLLICVFLLAPDTGGLVRLFLWRGQAQLRTDHVPAAERRWIRLAGPVTLGLVLAGALYGSAVQTYQPYPRPQTQIPLYGYWRVEHAASTVKDVPWTYVSVERPDHMAIQRNDGSSVRLDTKSDAPHHTIASTSAKFGKGQFQYLTDVTDPHRVTLTGSFNRGVVRFELQRIDSDAYPLLTRGFHWVSEFPYNR